MATSKYAHLPGVDLNAPSVFEVDEPEGADAGTPTGGAAPSFGEYSPLGTRKKARSGEDTLLQLDTTQVDALQAFEVFQGSDVVKGDTFDFSDALTARVAAPPKQRSIKSKIEAEMELQRKIGVGILPLSVVRKRIKAVRADPVTRFKALAAELDEFSSSLAKDRDNAQIPASLRVNVKNMQQELAELRGDARYHAFLDPHADQTALLAKQGELTASLVAQADVLRVLNKEGRREETERGLAPVERADESPAEAAAAAAAEERAEAEAERKHKEKKGKRKEKGKAAKKDKESKKGKKSKKSKKAPEEEEEEEPAPEHAAAAAEEEEGAVESDDEPWDDGAAVEEDVVYTLFQSASQDTIAKVSRVRELAARITRLRKLVGHEVAAAAADGTPLVDRVDALTARAKIVDVVHLDNVRRQLRLIVEQFDTLLQRNAREGKTPEDLVKEKKVTELSDLLTTGDEHAKQVASVVARLRSLAPVHTRVAEFDRTLHQVVSEQHFVDDLVATQSALLQQVRDSFQRNVGIIKGNVANMDARLKALDAKIATL